MLMLGFKAIVKKADFMLLNEVDSAEWIPIELAPDMLRKGGIAWELVNEILENNKAT